MAENEDQIRRVLEVGASLVAELDPAVVLNRILEEARQITGAEFAALGVLDESKSELDRFLTVGIDPATHRAIGDLPRGRGVLGVLIEDPRPLRLADVGHHPESYGFPAGHPPMRSFLGVPIVVRGQGWGNLYLTEKQGGGEFTQADEDAVVVLAQWAAIAIENARLYERSEHRREEAEVAVRGLEAARSIADAITGLDELADVLELIVKRGRSLVDARAVIIMLREGDELVIAATAGHASESRGFRLAIAGSTSGEVLERGRPQRIEDAGSRLRIAPERLGVQDAHNALLVPMLHRGAGIGLLAAFDRGAQGDTFTAADEELLRTFASSAASAVAIRRGVEADRLRGAINAADSERARWARELHDQTLQSLGALRVLLASALSRGGEDTIRDALRQAISDIELEIANLRGIITDLRPSLLDDLGLVPAIEALVERRREEGLEVISEFDLPQLGDGLPAELETTIYRIVQESLTNVVKHAQAKRVRVAVGITGGDVVIEVQDDGVGLDADAKTTGFGLAGMRERAYLAGGTVDVRSSEPGALVTVRLPAVRSAADAAGSGADQMAS